MLIDFLDKLKVLDESIVIITSDHGESLLEHGIYFNHHGLYDVTIHVPLVMVCPRYLPKGKRVKKLVQHIDLLPTILELLGITLELDIDGKSLLPAIFEGCDIRDAIYVSEKGFQRKAAIRTQKYKFIMSLEDPYCKFCRRIHGGVEELYDLENDPHELNNIVKEKRKIASNLRRKLQHWLQIMNSKRLQRVLKMKIRKLKKTLYFQGA